MSFDHLGLRKELLTTLKFQGYTKPTPIQDQAIPVVLKGGDVLAGSQTGTGKTAAFTLPLLEILSKKPGGHLPRVLVLAPTRELAAQVGESVETYSKGLPVRSVIVFGGVGINPQISKIKKGVDIIIGTPGRLLDLVSQGALDLSRIDHLVLDEADRMLDMGFIHDIRKVIRLVPEKRQTLFFSATYSKEVKGLADKILRDPVHVEVARENTAAETVTQYVYRVDKQDKRALLVHLIKEGKWEQVLVFTRTKHGANRLAQQLDRKKISATAIHGNKSQSARTKALSNFKERKVRVLVATDIAARGLDIDSLPYVVNYDLPQVSEDYVHRIGRTGRAGSSGIAVSLVADDEGRLLRDIERLINKSIEVKVIEGMSKPEDTPFVEMVKTRESRRQNRQNSGRRRNNNRRRGRSGGKGGSSGHSSDQKRSGKRNNRRKRQS